MLESKLQIFFGKYAVYIIAVLVFAVCMTTGAWYVTAYKLDTSNTQLKASETQLAVSNASFNSIKDQFSLLTKTLEANQDKALASHALLQQKLTDVIDADQSRLKLEQDLVNRAPTTECKTPEDLKNAWSKL